MHKVIYVKNKKIKLNLISLFGSFLFFIGILGFLIGLANLYETGNKMYSLKQCYENVAYNPEGVKECKLAFYNVSSVYLGPNEFYPTSNQQIIAIFTPIIKLLAWIALTILGLFFYNLGENFWRIYKKFKS